MERRDLIKDEIENLGKVLEGMLSALFGFKSKNNAASGVEVINERFSQELNIDMNELVAFDKEQLADYLKERKFTDVHFEPLADYLIEAGNSLELSDTTKSENYLKTALRLFEITDELTQTLCMTRLKKKNELLNRLN